MKITAVVYSKAPSELKSNIISSQVPVVVVVTWRSTGGGPPSNFNNTGVFAIGDQTCILKYLSLVRLIGTPIATPANDAPPGTVFSATFAVVLIPLVSGFAITWVEDPLKSPNSGNCPPSKVKGKANSSCWIGSTTTLPKAVSLAGLALRPITLKPYCTKESAGSTFVYETEKDPVVVNSTSSFFSNEKSELNTFIKAYTWYSGLIVYEDTDPSKSTWLPTRVLSSTYVFPSNILLPRPVAWSTQ